MKTPQHWLKLYAAECANLAGRQDNPPYLRAHHLALARAKPNGHCELKRGELALLLGKNGKRYRNAAGAIAQAIECGLLHSTSMPTCLVLPTSLTDPYDPTSRARHIECATHGGTPVPLCPADCHPSRKHYAHGLCEPCYRSARRAKVQEHVTEVQDKV